MEEEMEKKEQDQEAEELLQQASQTKLWEQIFSFAQSQTLRCAVDLRIPDIIHAHGGPTTISHLSSHLSLPCSPDCLRRLMSFLSHLNIFKHSIIATASGNQGQEGEDAYDLTPLSQLLVREAEKNLVPMVVVGFDVLMVPWHHMVGSLEKNADNAFKRVFGVEFYEYAEHNAEFGRRLNEVMACDTMLTMPAMIEELKEVLEGVDSLVDVGGGTGTAARAIAKAFPGIMCTVFDHPHVVEGAPKCTSVAIVGGDMFNFIPPADALLLKWILHNYGDEECTTILKRCKEALPEMGGKVIIVDTVMDGEDDEGDEFTRARLALDLEMMLLFGGKERTEDEWRRLLQHAGFNKCRILPIKSTIHSLIEASI